MNEQESSAPQSANLLPTALIALSLLLFFAWQLSIFSRQRSEVITSRSQLEEAYKNSGPEAEKALKQSQAVQNKLLNLATGIYNLAQSGDPDAKAIVEKAHIVNQTPTQAPAPAPAK